MENAKGEEDLALLEKLWELPAYIDKRPKPKKKVSRHFWRTMLDGVLFTLNYIGLATGYWGYSTVADLLFPKGLSSPAPKQKKSPVVDRIPLSFRREPYRITQIMDEGNLLLQDPKLAKRAEKVERRRLATTEDMYAAFNLEAPEESEEGEEEDFSTEDESSPEAAPVATPTSTSWEYTREDVVVTIVIFSLCGCFIIASIIGHC